MVDFEPARQWERSSFRSCQARLEWCFGGVVLLPARSTRRLKYKPECLSPRSPWQWSPHLMHAHLVPMYCLRGSAPPLYLQCQKMVSWTAELLSVMLCFTIAMLIKCAYVNSLLHITITHINHIFPSPKDSRKCRTEIDDPGTRTTWAYERHEPPKST